MAGFDDPEVVKAARLKGLETRRRRRDMTPEERALEAISSDLGNLTKELLDAALGKGDFEPHWVEDPESDERAYVPGLKPETRLAAILRAMEWKLGKPPTAKVAVKEQEPSAIPTGEELFTQASQ